LKTGMLFNAEIIEAVANAIKQYDWKNVVVDPVMIAKGGASLLLNEAIAALKTHLLPLAMIVTPNIPEAEVLTGMNIETLDDKKEAARRIIELGAKHVVIKGGHDEDQDEAIDVLFDGQDFKFFTSKRLATKNTHGTGCTFSAAIAAGLAKGMSVDDSVATAKDFIQAAIEDDLKIGLGHGPTNHWAYNRRNLVRE
jgi:hydroxymethylpyrimidine/phosphomethylpyrimidine kinase